MSEQESMKGDRLILALEHFQHWMSENYKLLIALFIVMFAAALVTQNMKQGELEQERAYWDLAAKAETTEARQAFIAKNMASQAAKIVSLELAREFLDAGEYAKAETTLSTFLKEAPEHPQSALAHLLRAYSREEQGKKSEAEQDFAKASEDTRLRLIAQAGISRLK